MHEQTWIPLISAIAGGALVGLINFGTNWVNKRSEERKHFQELILSISIEQWKQGCNFAIERAKLGQNTAIPPLDTYIIHLMKLAEVLELIRK